MRTRSATERDVFAKYAASALHSLKPSGDFNRGAYIVGIINEFDIRPLNLDEWKPDPADMVTPDGGETAEQLLSKPFYKEPFFPFRREESGELQKDKEIHDFLQKMYALFQPDEAEDRAADEDESDEETRAAALKTFDAITKRLEAVDVDALKKEYLSTYQHFLGIVSGFQLRRANEADDFPKLENTVKVFAALFAGRVLGLMKGQQQKLKDALDGGREDEFESKYKAFQKSVSTLAGGGWFVLFKAVQTFEAEGGGIYPTRYGGLEPYLGRLELNAPDRAKAAEDYARRTIEKAFSFRFPWFAEIEKKHARQIEKEARAELPVIRTKRAEERTDAIDKITQYLPQNIYLDGRAELAMEKKGSRNKISAFVSLIPDENITAEMSKFDSKDVVVLNAIYSIIQAGNNVMTEQQIFDVMTGGTGKPATKKQLEDILKRVYRYIHFGLNMDVSEEAVSLGYEKGAKIVRSTQIIPGEMDIMKNINGQVTSCLVIHATPPLLWYAERKGQLLRYPVNMLDVGLNNTDDVIILKNYLASRVRSRLQPVVLYDTIYKQLGDLGKSAASIRNKKAKIREAVKEIMEQFKKQGEIKRYRNTTKGKEIHSIEFERA